MIQVADNFNYRGKKPNFDRDSFDTLQDMKNYSEISKENPLIVTLFFIPLYHLTQILDGDKNWEINNGGYTKDIISINNYPFAYLENSNIVNNYRETLNKNIGNTSNRPIEASKGFQYFDTTINKPIFWDGTKWIDATGATV